MVLPPQPISRGGTVLPAGNASPDTNSGCVSNEKLPTSTHTVNCPNFGGG
jgi:hypothetical protein